MGSRPLAVCSLLPVPCLLAWLTAHTHTRMLSSDQLNALIYWENPRNSGIVFGPMLVCLLAVRYISLISVIGNVALALVTATISFRIYKSVLAAVNKSSEGHPFRQFMDSDVALPSDKVNQLTDSFVARLNSTLAKLKSIFLVEDVLESVKFGVSMYLLTYVGAILNGLTVLILKAKLEELQAKVMAAV